MTKTQTYYDKVVCLSYLQTGLSLFWSSLVVTHGQLGQSSNIAPFSDWYQNVPIFQNVPINQKVHFARSVHFERSVPKCTDLSKCTDFIFRVEIV